jgi:hypothetical protein
MRSYIFTKHEARLLYQYMKDLETQATRDLFVDLRRNSPHLLNDLKLYFLVRKKLSAQNRWDTNRVPRKIKQQLLQKILNNEPIIPDEIREKMRLNSTYKSNDE